jgi:hypothetical protein
MRPFIRVTMFLLVVLMFGVISAQAQYVEAHKIDTVSKDLPEAQVLTVLSEHLGVPSETLKKQKTDTGLPIGQLYIAHALAKASKSDVSQLLADNKTKSWGEIAKAKNVKMKVLGDDVDKLEKDLKGKKTK